MLPETDAFQGGHRGRMTVFHQFVFAACPPEYRMLVARVGGQSPAGGNLDHRQPDRDEQLGFVALAQLFVHIF